MVVVSHSSKPVPFVTVIQETLQTSAHQLHLKLIQMSSKKKISNPNKYIDKSFQGFQMPTIKAKGNILYPAGKQSLIKLDF